MRWLIGLGLLCMLIGLERWRHRQRGLSLSTAGHAVPTAAQRSGSLSNPTPRQQHTELSNAGERLCLQEPRTLPWPSTHRSTPSARFPCEEYVIGFSTGHVATTTLSNRELFVDGMRPKSDIAMLFEVGRLSAVRYANASLRDEAEHARRTYLPALARHKRPVGARVCADLSHTSLFFADGLLRTLSSLGARVRVVRLRRARREVAHSFEQAFDRLAVREAPAGSAACLPVCVGFCPRLNPSRVLLPLPLSAWRALSAYGKALWMVDETEARWQALLLSARDAATLPFNVSEVGWSKAESGSFEQAVGTIAALLGLRASGPVPDTNTHTHGANHQSRDQAADNETRRLEREEAAYCSTMRAHVRGFACPGALAYA